MCVNPDTEGGKASVVLRLARNKFKMAKKKKKKKFEIYLQDLVFIIFFFSLPLT